MKTKFSFLALALFCSAILLGSCSKNDNGEGQEPEFVGDRSVYIRVDNKSKAKDLHFHFTGDHSHCDGLMYSKNGWIRMNYDDFVRVSETTPTEGCRIGSNFYFDGSSVSTWHTHVIISDGHDDQIKYQIQGRSTVELPRHVSVFQTWARPERWLTATFEVQIGQISEFNDFKSVFIVMTVIDHQE